MGGMEARGKLPSNRSNLQPPGKTSTLLVASSKGFPIELNSPLYSVTRKAARNYQPSKAKIRNPSASLSAMWAFPQSHHPRIGAQTETSPIMRCMIPRGLPVLILLHHPLKATAELSALTLLTSILRHPPGLPGCFHENHPLPKFVHPADLAIERFSRGASTKITQLPKFVHPVA